MANLLRTPPAAGEINKNTPSTNKRQRVDDLSGSAEKDVNENSITLEGMMKTMMQQFTETKLLMNTMRSEINDVRSDIRDVNSKIDSVRTELKTDIKSVKDECAAKFQRYDAALDSLNEKVDRVSQTVGALENRNELIISGIPFQTGENLSAMLKQIGKHLVVNEPTTSLMEPRRTKSGSGSDRDGVIVVEFALKTTRDEFYSAYLRKRDLTLKHIGLNSDRRIYINESLTIDARKVKSAALRLKKAGKISSVYTKLGVIYVKPAAVGPSVVIRSEDELEKFM